MGAEERSKDLEGSRARNLAIRASTGGEHNE